MSDVPRNALGKAQVKDREGTPPTSALDCEEIGNCGGPEKDRFYYPSGKKLGPLLEESRICEICGVKEDA